VSELRRPTPRSRSRDCRRASSRASAREKCHGTARALAIWLRVAGIECRIIRALGPRITTYLAEWEIECRNDVPQHAVYVEERAVVDFTWRMWEPEGPFPRIATLDDYMNDFDLLDETVCGHCGNYVPSVPCRHMSPADERLLASQL
jgi:hypothetical protein